MDLPRVKAVLGILHALAPKRLLDIGTGRGVFLWPLLDAFPDLHVTAIEPDLRRARHLVAVSRGGIDRLTIVQRTAELNEAKSPGSRVPEKVPKPSFS